MTAQEAHQRICELETKHDLLQYKVDGWCVWPLFRFSATLAIQNISLGSSQGLSTVERYASALKDLTAFAFPKKAEVVVKTYSSARVESEGSLYKDVYFDDLLREIRDFYKIESVNNRIFFQRGKKAFYKSDMTTNGLNIVASQLVKTGSPQSVADMGRKLGRLLEKEPGLGRFSPSAVILSLLSFYWMKRLYYWLLGRIKPKYLFVADPGEYEIIAAAKERGIKVIEFQHGIVDRHNASYSWPVDALPHKASMPLPDRIFLYGDHWMQELGARGFWKDELRPVGCLRMDNYRKAVIQKDETFSILVTTQGIDVEKIIEFMLQFMRHAADRPDIRVIFKLHPLYDHSKSRYQEAFSGFKNSKVFLGNEGSSTFELLTKCRLHASISSACHYDALALGVLTIILPFATHETVLHLYEAGHAALAATPQDLWQLVSTAEQRPVPEEVRNQYFKTGAIENMKKELAVLS